MGSDTSEMWLSSNNVMLTVIYKWTNGIIYCYDHQVISIQLHGKMYNI
jgi:hypothetical protein